MKQLITTLLLITSFSGVSQLQEINYSLRCAYVTSRYGDCDDWPGDEEYEAKYWVGDEYILTSSACLSCDSDNSDCTYGVNQVLLSSMNTLAESMDFYVICYENDYANPCLTGTSNDCAEWAVPNYSSFNIRDLIVPSDTYEPWHGYFGTNHDAVFELKWNYTGAGDYISFITPTCGWQLLPTVSGSINSYGFGVLAGESVSITACGSSGTEPMMIRVFDNNGHTLLATNTGFGPFCATSNPSITTPIATGTQGYYIDVCRLDGTALTEQPILQYRFNRPPIADASLSTLSGECSITPPTPTATDLCDGSINGVADVSFPITNQGTTTVTWTYTDNDGNTSTQTQNVINTDVTGPVPDVSNLLDITAECEVTSLTAPSATDNCSSVAITNNASLPINTQGTTVVTWTYTDAVGNSTIQTQNVIIQDVTAPVILSGISDILSECDVTSLTDPIATDNCGGIVTITNNAVFPITSGLWTVNWTFEDESGNTSSASHMVTVEDATAPVPTTLVLPQIFSECEINSLTPQTATDNCSAVIVTNDATFPITTGTTTVTWTYTDLSGNSSSQIVDVIVSDIIAPVPNLLVLPPVFDECEITSLPAQTATDNCTAVTVTNDAIFPITSSTIVTWTYTDLSGNSSTQTQNVDINDLTSPVPDSLVLEDLTSECEISILTPPTGTDNCGSVTVTHDATIPINTEGTTVVVWTFNDGNGNTSTQTQNVIITSIDSTINQVGAATYTANATGYTYQWVDCNDGYSLINGETNQTYTASSVGSYAVEISNGNCTVTSACVEISLSIIENEFGDELLIYPNPTGGEFTIDLGKIYHNVEITILDASGRTVLEKNMDSAMMIPLEIQEPSGEYFITITTEEGVSGQMSIIKN